MAPTDWFLGLKIRKILLHNQFKNLTFTLVPNFKYV